MYILIVPINEKGLSMKIAISGAGGFLGWNICRVAIEQGHDITGIIHNKDVHLDRCATERCDLTNPDDTEKLIERIRPDIFIHCAATSDPNFCQQNQELAEKLNVQSSSYIAHLCARKNIAFSFTSTDLVFDGTSAPYDESAAINPLSVYGVQKAAAERAILHENCSALVCRMPLMFGAVPQGVKRFLQQWIDQLQSGNRLSLFTDEYRTPVSAVDASRGLLMFTGNVHGILHLGGLERISRYDFGLILAELQGVSPDLINGCRQRDLKMAAPRPADVSLNSNKAFNLGFSPGSISSELQEILF
jgi:dTDP-4-dehydrorhamnose reductase